MPATFMLHVISPEKAEFEGPIESVTVPGGSGYFGVLAHHAPILTTIGQGVLTFYDERARMHEYRVSGGFFEMQSNEATVLVHEIAPAAKI